MENPSPEVTTQKPKNPGRVEWGKQLGKMSKERKLKKEDIALPSTLEQPVQSNLVKVSIAALLLGIGLFMYTQKRSSPPPIVAINPTVLEENKTATFPDF